MKHNTKPKGVIPTRSWRKTLEIPEIPYPGSTEIKELIQQNKASAQPSPAMPVKSPEPAMRHISSELAAIGTHIWRAKRKMTDTASGEPLEEMRRVIHHIDAVLDTFSRMDLEIHDHTGEFFDYGSPLTVITTQPTPGLKREQVIETIRPTIYWSKRIIQQGEVVIATPAPTSKQEPAL